ncbi:ESCRT-II complex vps25 subunit [Dacryopinax primogenitus]|uniref:ESCRT-II complex vps25 subunit n=1 Tax=Dacryopinax primogenitus (strain DJM 731) TaxID=1858805 RepID=M5G033_DACPD|nr:ESCRT-II complex vps25 subunit [Dacryopinax primogenitus]EJU03621.1 ESCRT-II complex vps25 subunit [Dacryopinax primogenitus]
MGLELAPVKVQSGFLLPSIHSWPAFFTYQPNPRTFSTQREHWTTLILTYARFARIWELKVGDVDDAASGGVWGEVLHNPRLKPPRTIGRKMLQILLEQLIEEERALPDPPKQSSSVILCWRTIPEWAGILHDWAVTTGQTNTILTLFEISNPQVPSDLSGMPEPLLRRAIALLQKTGKAQVIEGADGGGVRFFP